MNSSTIFFSVLLLATLYMFGAGAKGMVVSVARPRGGKIRKGTSVISGIVFMLIGFLFSMLCFSIVIPSFGDVATVISTLVLCLVSAAVQVKMGLSKKPAVAAAAVAAADAANTEAMAAVTRVEPTIAPTQDVAATSVSTVSTVVPAAAVTAAAVSSTVAPASLAIDDASDELDAWADDQEEIPAAAPSTITKVAAAPVVTPSTTSASIAELTDVVAPVAAAAPAAPQLDLVDAALLSEQYEAFDPALRHMNNHHDDVYEELIGNMHHHDASHVA